MSAKYDWSYLNQAVNTKNTRLAFSEVQHLFKKVAFDVYKQNDTGKLWELRSDDEGEYLVALYEDENTDLVVNSEEEEANTVWNATADSEGENITLSYQNTPIARFASSTYKFSPDTAERFAEFIEKKALDSKFIEDLLNTMPENKRLAVLELLQKGVN